MSDDPHDRSFAQQALDALVFAPTGALLTAVEDLPGMAAKGRARLEVQVRNAHLLGELAVRYGRQDLTRRLARLAGAGPTAPAEGPEPVPPPDREPPVPPPRPPPSAAGLAIPDYDTLSASQVVRRLDGLGRQELEAVYQHELAARRRRTILHRAQQLLGP